MRPHSTSPWVDLSLCRPAGLTLDTGLPGQALLALPLDTRGHCKQQLLPPSSSARAAFHTNLLLSTALCGHSLGKGLKTASTAR